MAGNKDKVKRVEGDTAATAPAVYTADRPSKLDEHYDTKFNELDLSESQLMAVCRDLSK